MSDFTPGPWTIEPDGDGGWDVRAENDYVCECNKYTPTIDSDGRNNARLIAAAPEMYEALKKATEAATNAVCNWEHGDLAGAVHDLDCLRDDWDNLLAKIEGSDNDS